MFESLAPWPAGWLAGCCCCRRRILDEYATRFPRSNSAQELALELKWLLEQVGLGCAVQGPIGWLDVHTRFPCRTGVSVFLGLGLVP